MAQYLLSHLHCKHFSTVVYCARKIRGEEIRNWCSMAITIVPVLVVLLLYCGNYITTATLCEIESVSA